MTPRGKHILSWTLAASCLSQITAATRTDGYTKGQPMPVTCLNRNIESGEHITDEFGKLQFIPFPTCKETSAPLALPYGLSQTVNCTIDALPDELYHLFEYYVHSDVPMTCRVPTAPLISDADASKPKSTEQDSDEEVEAKKEANGISVLDDDGPPYTPITFAVQGTLQKSHLHIWTDMNVLAHNIPQVPVKGSSRKPKKGQGYIVAGTAYSVPEFEYNLLHGKGGAKGEKSSPEKEESAVAEAAREPWTAGHGTKVIRGEPLTFTFHLTWVEGGRGIGWPGRDVSSGGSGFSWFFGKVFFFGLAASLGALVALYWERNGGGVRRRAWKGDGILGVPSLSKGAGAVGVSFGNGGKANGYGYGGYSAGSSGNGYGGFSSGKRD